MFELARPLRAAAAPEPVEVALADRIARLARAPLRIAYFYEHPDNSTFRYRVGNMIATINQESADSGMAATYFTGTEVDDLARLSGLVDVLVICRARFSHRLARLVARMRASGVPVLYDVDDLVFDPDYAPLLMETIGIPPDEEPHLIYWFSYCARIAAALRLCDAAIVTNAELGSQLQRASGLSYAILPNFLNQEQMEVSQLIWEQKRAAGFRCDQNWHIGYFSGSHSHNRDFALVAEPLARLMRQDPRVILRVVGFLELGGAFEGFEGRVERFELQETADLQWLIGEVNVSISPLQDNVFTKCKSDLKWFEAAVAGTVTVASPSGGVGARILDGSNGVIARSYDWYEILGNLVGEGATCRRLAETARAEALAECTPAKQLPRIRQVMHDATTKRFNRPRSSPSTSSGQDPQSASPALAPDS